MNMITARIYSDTHLRNMGIEACVALAKYCWEVDNTKPLFFREQPIEVQDALIDVIRRIVNSNGQGPKGD